MKRPSGLGAGDGQQPRPECYSTLRMDVTTLLRHQGMTGSLAAVSLVQVAIVPQSSASTGPTMKCNHDLTTCTGGDVAEAARSSNG